MTPESNIRDQADKLRAKDAQDADERLDDALEDSMDASDPPSSTQPGDNGDPAPSSGYKPED